ncbi:MAG: hypothetical protein ACRDI3_03205 [Actinomycetota bacterium]
MELSTMRPGRRFVGIILCASLTLITHAGPVAAETEPPTVKEFMRAPGAQPLLRIAREFGRTRELEQVLRTHLDQTGDVATEEFAFTYTTGDLSGDGREDLAVVHYRIDLLDSEINTRITTTVVEGKSGRSLWRRVIKGHDIFAFPWSARVGTDGDPGIWLIKVQGFGFQSTEMTYVIRALDRHGKKMWSKRHETRIVGDWPIAFAADDYLVTLAGLRALPGRATDLLLASGPVVYSIGPDHEAGVITSELTNGNTGKATGASVTEIGARFVPFAAAMHDLDGRPGHDYAFLNEAPAIQIGDPEDPIAEVEPLSGVVTGVGSRTGTRLWMVPGINVVEQNEHMSDLGDVNGDGVGDVFVETSAQYFREDPKDQYRTYFIDGGRAELIWESFGQWPYSPGDLDGDGRKDFLTQAYYSSEGYTATRVWAVGSRGKRLWSREHRTEHPLTSCCSLLFHVGDESWGVGDLNGDGLADGALWHWGGSFQARIEEHLLIDARRGRLLLRGDELTFPLAASVDRGTTDIVELDWSVPNDLVIKTRDGAGGRVRTESRVRLGVPLNPLKIDVYPWAAQLTNDSCADIGVSVYSPTTTYEMVFSGATGKLLWSRTTAGPGGDVSLIENTDRNRAC